MEGHDKWEPHFAVHVHFNSCPRGQVIWHDGCPAKTIPHPAAVKIVGKIGAKKEKYTLSKFKRAREQYQAQKILNQTRWRRYYGAISLKQFAPGNFPHKLKN